MNNYENYINRCFQLANLGLGNVSPNPLVGCVIVYNDRIIGEGYHQKYGEPHAEINAINSVENRELLKQSTLFVNLEPCSHLGKTPPCANRIIDEGIPKVVISNFDSNKKVSGRGIEILRNNGVEVIERVLESEGRNLNKRFFLYHEKNRPYIILKWAQTKDGFVDIDRNMKNKNQQYWISNYILKMIVHKWRTEEDAIMIGSNTAINDNPKLNVREWHGPNPIRIVIDSNGNLKSDLNVFNNEQKTIFFTQNIYPNINNIEQIKLPLQNNINFVLENLYKNQIQSIIVEGGKKLLETFINENLWDEARVITGDKYFHNGLKAPILRKSPNETNEYLNDTLTTYYNF